MKKAILASVLMASFLVGNSNAIAHSDHDHSFTGIKWEFTDQTNANIRGQMEKYPQTQSFGISRFENKIMDQYGLREGRTFNAKIDNKSFRFQRTTSGVKLVKRVDAEQAFNLVSLPINRVHQTIPTSTMQRHIGHDHSHFSHEWVFSEKIQRKVEDKIKSENLSGLVGLSKFDRVELEHYGIRVGMTFMSSALHSRLMAKLTTGGIQIMKVVAPTKVAALPSNLSNSAFLTN